MRRILAIKLADFGDVLLTTPALRRLREAYPDARLDVLTTQTGRAALNVPYIDDVLVFDKYGFDRVRSLANPAKLVKLAGFGLLLRRRGYDAVVIFHHLTTRAGSLKFRALAAATGAKHIVGLDNSAAFGDGRGRFLTLGMPDDGFGATPERDYWLKLVDVLTQHPRGVTPLQPLDGEAAPDFMVSDADRAWADTFVTRLQLAEAQPLILVHGGAGWYRPARKWPVESYAALVGLLSGRLGAQVILLGGKDEVALAEEIIASQRHRDTEIGSRKEHATFVGIREDGVEGNPINLAGKTSLGQVAALLARATLYIGNDNGITHLAGAVGAPTLAIFGPTNAAAWSPYGYDLNAPDTGRTRIISAATPLPCRPCMYRGHDLGLANGCATRPCLTDLTPHEVFSAAQRLIRDYGLDSLPVMGAQ